MISEAKLDWSPPPAIPRLEGIGVHVWAANLDAITGAVPTLISLLSPDERQRADRLHAARQRNRFIAARGMLRTILASYSGWEPAELAFTYGAHGKPEIMGGTERQKLHFNLAHSEDLAVIAVTRCSPLGIDVEKIQPITDVLEITDHFFSRRESTWLRTLPEDRRLEAFYRIWTCKEACLKARGDRLSELLPEIDVTSALIPPRLLSMPDEKPAPARWTLEKLKPSADSVAALAAPVLELHISCYRWLPEGMPRVMTGPP